MSAPVHLVLILLASGEQGATASHRPAVTDPEPLFLRYARAVDASSVIFVNDPGGDQTVHHCLFAAHKPSLKRCLALLNDSGAPAASVRRAMQYIRRQPKDFQVAGMPWSGFGAAPSHETIRAAEKSAHPLAVALRAHARTVALDKKMARRDYALAAQRAEKAGQPLQWGHRLPEVSEAEVRDAREELQHAFARAFAATKHPEIRAWISARLPP